MIRDKHDCANCPRNTAPHEQNPEHACQYVDVSGMSPRRQKVIKIVHRLMANNQHPWCQFDYGFRFMVVQSAVVALEHSEELQRREMLYKAAKAGIILPAPIPESKLPAHHTIQPRKLATV